MQPGQSERELNPYWKNGGSGLPPPKPLNQHKGFLKPKADDDDDICHYNSYHQSNHTKTSYGRQSWKKHDRRDEKNNSFHDTEKQDNEGKYYQRKEYDERKPLRSKYHREHEDEKSKRYREYDDEKNKRRREYDDERKGEKDKRHRNYEDERRGEKDKSFKDNDHKKEIKSKHYTDLCEANDSVKEKQKETNSNKYENDNKRTKEHNEDIEKPLTDSELNALAAKQIKAELMGNTVSYCIFFF